MRTRGAVGLALVFAASHADAKPAHLSSYVVEKGAESCPDAETFKVSFAREQCPPQWTPGDGPDVRVVFRSDGKGLVAQFEIDGGRAEKRSATRTCTELHAQVVTAIAFALDACPGDAPSPHVESVSPQFVIVGTRASLTVTGKRFDANAKAAAAGVENGTTTVLDDETLELGFDVPVDSPPGVRSVTVKNPNGRSHTLENAFVVQPVPAPRVSSVAPDSGAVGDTVLVELAGRDFMEDATILVAGVEVLETTHVSSTVMRATLRIPETSDFTARDVTVLNPKGADAFAVLAGGFTVTDVPMRIDFVTPPEIRRGQGATLTVHGDNFPPDAIVSFAGEGTSLRNLGTTFVDASTLRVRVEVATDADAGAREVRARSERSHTSATRSAALSISEGPSPPGPRGPVFVATEGAQGFWSGGSHGEDEHFQSSVWAGEVTAGGESPLTKGYTFDVLVSGYGAERKHRRDWQDLEIYGRNGQIGPLYVRQSVGATALRGLVRRDLDDVGVSLGLVAGGLRQAGCHHERTKDWESPLCGDLQQWAAFPAFGLRMGSASGGHVSLGVLDGRLLFGELAHLGGGFRVRGDRPVEIAAVAAAEGLGVRGQTEILVGRRWVLLPALSGGMWYETFTEGGNNYWIRAGLGVGMRASPTY